MFVKLVEGTGKTRRPVLREWSKCTACFKSALRHRGRGFIYRYFDLLVVIHYLSGPRFCDVAGMEPEVLFEIYNVGGS